MKRIPQAIGFAIGMMFVGIVFRLFQISSFEGAIIGGLTGGVAYFILEKLFESQDEDPDASGNENLIIYAAMAVFALVSLTSFYWNESGFCAIQTKASIIDVGPTSMEQVFKGQSDSMTLIESEEKNCLERGGWEYMSTFGTIALSVSALVIVLPLIIMLGLFLFMLSKKDDEELTTTPLRVFTASELITKTEKMIESQEYRSKRGELQWIEFPDSQLVKCTEDERQRVLEVYRKILDDLPNVYTKESEAKTLESRIKKFTKLKVTAEKIIGELSQKS